MEGNALPRAVGRGSGVDLDLVASHVSPNAAAPWANKKERFETFKGDPY